jgi:hypothetical protein
MKLQIYESAIGLEIHVQHLTMNDILLPSFFMS